MAILLANVGRGKGKALIAAIHALAQVLVHAIEFQSWQAGQTSSET
jgi:hypothetical protein